MVWDSINVNLSFSLGPTVITHTHVFAMILDKTHMFVDFQDHYQQQNGGAEGFCL